MTLLFAVSCVTALAAGTTVTIGDIQAKAGDTAEIPVVLAGNTGFSNLSLEIGYNSDVMTLSGVSSPVSGASFTMAQTYAAQPYNMQWDCATDITYNGTVAVMTFTINAGTANGTYPVTVDFYKGRDGNNVDGDDINYNADYDPIPITYISGSVIVSGGGEPGEDPVGDTACVTVRNMTAKAGETVEVPVVLSGNPGFSNLAIEIGYNNNVMTLTDVTSPVGGASFTAAQTYAAQPYNMQWDCATDVTYNGTLAVLTFLINSGTADGTYPVTVDFYKGRGGDNVDGDDVNYRADYTPLALTYKSGGITVQSKEGSGLEVVGKDIANKTVNVRLTAETYTGDLWAALYDASGRPAAVRRYPAAESVDVSFDKSATGSYVKIMWWGSGSCRPLCDAMTVPLA